MRMNADLKDSRGFSRGVRVREARQDDAPIVVHAERASSTAAHWPETAYQNAVEQAKRMVLVAEVYGEVAGFLVASTAAAEWELENIAVQPEAQQQGIGRALVDALIERARAAGAAEIRQEIRASNQAALRLG